MRNKTIHTRIPVRILCLILCLILCIFLSMAAGGCKNIKETAMAIVSINPTEILSHTTFELRVNGYGFSTNSVIVFNGTEVATTFVSQWALRADIDATLTDFPLTTPQMEVAVWVVEKKSSGEIQQETDHLLITVLNMYRFSDPRTIYDSGDPYLYFTGLKIRASGNGTLYLVWQEHIWEMAGTGEVGSANHAVEAVDKRGVALTTIPPSPKLAYSTDSGQTWTFAPEMKVNRYFFAEPEGLYVFPPNVYYEDGGYDDTGGGDSEELRYYFSPDNGETWETRTIGQQEPGREFRGYAVCRDGSGKFIFVYGQEADDNMLRIVTYHSTDSGLTWNEASEFLTACETGKSDTVYGYGIDWITANGAGGVVLGCRYRSVIPNAVSRVYKSGDGGESYQEFSDGISERNIYAMNTPFLTDQGTLKAFYTDNYYYRVYKLTYLAGDDYGSQIQTLHHFTENDYFTGDMVKDNDDNLYVVWGIEISRSTDEGQTWSPPMTLPIETVYARTTTIDTAGMLHMVFSNDVELILISAQPAEASNSHD